MLLVEGLSIEMKRFSKKRAKPAVWSVETRFNSYSLRRYYKFLRYIPNKKETKFEIGANISVEGLDLWIQTNVMSL